MILVVFICVLNVTWFILDLFGYHVTAHFDIPRFIPAHSYYLSILFSCECSDVSLLVMIAKSFAYITELIMDLDAPKVYPKFCFCNHLSSGSKNMIKTNGLRVSPCIMPLCINISFVWPKYSPVYMVLECEYMLPTNLIASSRYPKSFMIANKRA